MPKPKPRKPRLSHMPSVRHLNRSNSSRKTLTPGITAHAGLCPSGQTAGDESGRKRSRSLNKKIARLGSGREEGVLYTVKVAPHNPYKPNQPGVSRDSIDDEEDIPPQSIEPQQYTIDKMRQGMRITMCSRLCRSFGIELGKHEDVDSHLYKPSKGLATYLNWTYYASFLAVFFSFLVIFIFLCLIFAGLYTLVGELQPDCIVVSGSQFGTNPHTKFRDAVALSWTTFTTVGYGNTYPATGTDLDVAGLEAFHCSGVVFLCTFEAFLGLIYAGMCAAILFGKVNRVQSHAHLSFANAVCLQYEEVDNNLFVDDDTSDSDCDGCDTLEEEEEENDKVEGPVMKSSSTKKLMFQKNARRHQSFMDQFAGCPVLKFQVVNDLCNKAGAEIIDGLMKVVGIKSKRCGGKVTATQYVRVQLVECEHPFFGRVWHGVHILDGSSPLLTAAARQRIRENGGSWPISWLEQGPQKIRRKLDFQSLVVTVAGISNVSASAVHAYKRYKNEDVIIGFDFAPLVYEDEDSGNLEVALDLVNDVIEQLSGHGENLKESTNDNLDEGSSIGSLFSRGTSSVFKESMFQRASKT